MTGGHLKFVWSAAAALVAGCLGACATTGPGAFNALPRDISIAGSRIFPESLSADSLGTLYIGSNPGTIYRARSGDTQAAPWIVPDAANGLQQVFGVLVDEPRGLLWICSNPARGASGSAALRTFDLTSGAARASYPFPAGPALCNDIAIEPGGRVYATDTVGGRIVTLAPGAHSLETWAASADLRGVDGIALGGGSLYVNNVQKNWLARVARAADGTFAGLAMVATSLPLSGPDGLRALGGNRFLQAEGPGGRVALLTIRGDKARMLPLATGIDYPASMVLVGRTLYVAEGKIGYLIDPAKRELDPGTFTVRAFAAPAGL
ncbi:MAG: hypothetical protein ABIP41_08940 [Croceibacterium sp.]